jgi:hypothetical protein
VIPRNKDSEGLWEWLKKEAFDLYGLLTFGATSSGVSPERARRQLCALLKIRALDPTEKGLLGAILENDETAVQACCDYYEENNLPEGAISLKAVYPFPGAIVVLRVPAAWVGGAPVSVFANELKERFGVPVIALPEDCKLEVWHVGEKDALVLYCPSLAQRGTIEATERELERAFPNNRVLYAYHEVGVAPGQEGVRPSQEEMRAAFGGEGGAGQ